MIRAELVTVHASAGETLPALVDRAARALAGARSSAEVLEARDLAGFVYDTAKRAARIAQAKGAHDQLVAAAHRAQADALLIESQAKRRLADEYDAAQERGEIGRGNGRISDPEILPATSVVPPKQIYEARQIRDAEVRSPGIAERAVQAMLDRGAEPTRAELKRAIGPSEYLNQRAAAEEREWQAKRDFKAIRKAWNAACVDGRALFDAWRAAQK